MTQPKGLLSFLFHVTGIAAYRTETHEDIDTSFDRFEVPDEARTVCRNMRALAERARRSDSNTTEILKAEVELAQLSQELFNAHVLAQLAAFPAQAQREQDRDGDRFASVADAANSWLLLDVVYVFAYGSDKEVATLLDGELRNHKFATAFQTLRGDTRPIPDLEEVCSALGDEYGELGWKRCW